MNTRQLATAAQERDAEGDTEARPARQWEPFPQPADCSVKWDFEGLSQPPRARDQVETTGATSRDA